MNENLKQLGKQLIDIWKQLGLNQRISVVLAFGVVVIGLAGLAYFSSRQDFVLVAANLEPGDSAELVTYLEEKKIPYEIGGGGSLISVPRDKAGSIRVQFGSKFAGGGVVGDEILENPNVMLSDAMQKAQLKRAENGELARMIQSMDSISWAKVRVSVPPNRLLIRGEDDHPKASVVVKVRGGRSLTRHTVQAITSTVAGAVDGLKPAHVSVSDTLGQLYTEDYDEDSMVGVADRHFAVRHQVETMFERKARAMLDAVLGPGQSTIKVAVELNTDSITSTERKIDPETKVERTKTEKEETTTSSTGGGPTTGLTANTNIGTGSTNTASGASVNSNDSSIKTTDVTNEFDESVRQIVQMAGGIKRISAAVMINTRYEGEGAERSTIQRTPEEIDQLKEIVQSALGIRTDQNGDRVDTISLLEIPFNEEPMLEMSQEIARFEKIDFWMGIARKVAYPALAVVILLMFVRSLKRTRTDDIPVGVPVGELDADGGFNGLSDWKTGSKPRTVTVDVLNQLVKENPHNMTQAIRTWMGGAKNN